MPQFASASSKRTQIHRTKKHEWSPWGFTCKLPSS